MPVSSYVLRCAPEDQSSVRQQLNRLPGVEIGEGTDRGIPVAVGADTTMAAEAIGGQLQNLQGVKAAVLVYHNFEDLAGETQAKARSCKRTDETS
jgi:nitrate reductase NapAB chaperone NapD